MSGSTAENQMDQGPWGPPEGADAPEDAFLEALDADPDEVENLSDTDPDEDPLDEGEEVADEVAEEPEEEIDQDEGDEPPEGVSAKAQERYRELANGNRELKRENEDLRALVQQVMQQQQQQMQRQDEVFTQERTRQQTVREQQKQQALMAELKRHGFDETLLEHRLSLDAVNRTMAAEQRLAALEQRLESINSDRQERVYHDALNREIDTYLGGATIDGDVRKRLFETAYQNAVQAQLPPADAVKSVEMFLRLAKQAAKPAPKPKPKIDPETQRAVSIGARRGGTGGAPVGRSNRPKTAPDLSPEEEFFAQFTGRR